MYAIRSYYASRSKIEAEIKKVEDAVATNNTEQIKSATEALNKVWGEVAQELYAQQGPGAGGPGQQQQPGENAGEPQSEKKEDVQDASYEVVEDDDKDDKSYNFV